MDAVPPESTPEVVTAAEYQSIESGTLTASHLNQLLDRLRLEPDETGVVSIAARVARPLPTSYMRALFGPPENRESIRGRTGQHGLVPRRPAIFRS